MNKTTNHTPHLMRGLHQQKTPHQVRSVVGAVMYMVFSSLVLLGSITDARAEKAEALIAQTIKDAGGVNSVNDELRVDVVKGKAQLQQLEKDNLISLVKVTKIDFDIAAGSFTAFVSLNDNLPFETNGTFAETVKLPVLARKYSKDEVIAKQDIAYLDIEASKIKGSFITDESVMIGKALTRPALKGRPVELSALTEPKVMDKNKVITLSYNNSALKIQTNGVALENGSLGQTIKFKNQASGKIVLAKIMDDSTAQVQPAENVLASN